MKLVLTLVALSFAAATLAQGNTDTKEYYLNKSKNQKTTGHILVGAGTALIFSGLIVGNSGQENNSDGLDFGPNFDVGLWLIGGGLACGAASIPFYISAGNNARKAATIAVSRRKLMLPTRDNPVVYQPTITLKIPL